MRPSTAFTTASFEAVVNIVFEVCSRTWRKVMRRRMPRIDELVGVPLAVKRSQKAGKQAAKGRREALAGLVEGQEPSEIVSQGVKRKLQAHASQAVPGEAHQSVNKFD